MSSQTTPLYQRQIDSNLNADDSFAKLIGFIGQGERVLDVGCGDGALGAYLIAEKDAQVIGLERDAERLAIAQTQLDAAYPIDLAGLADAPLSQFLPETVSISIFDSVVLADVLEHLYDPLSVLTAVKSHLGETGRLLISIPNAAYTGALLALYHDDWFYQDEGILDRTHVRFYTQKTILALLAEAGYQAKIVDFVGKDLRETEFYYRLDSLAPAVRDWLLAKPNGAVYQWIIEARPASQFTQASALAEFLGTQISTPFIARDMFVLHSLHCYWQNQTEFTSAQVQTVRQPMGARHDYVFQLGSTQLDRVRLDLADKRGVYDIFSLSVFAGETLLHRQESFEVVSGRALFSVFPSRILAEDEQTHLLCYFPQSFAGDNISIVVSLHAPMDPLNLGFATDNNQLNKPHSQQIVQQILQRMDTLDSAIAQLYPDNLVTASRKSIFKRLKQWFNR